MRSKLAGVTAAAPLGLRERKKQQTRSLLHRAALDLVLEHGPDDVTVEQIAAKAQVSTRTFFNYYATKDAAIAGVTPEFADLVVADFTAAARDAGVLTALERALARRVSGLVSDGALRRQRAEVTLRVKGRDIFVEQSHEDLYAAIDQLMDKLDRQVMRHKDRLQEHHHAAPKRLATPAS